MDWKELISSIGGNAVVALRCRISRSPGRTVVEIFLMAAGRRKNTTRYLTFGKASGDPQRQRSLARRSRAFLFTASVCVKNIGAKGQRWACLQDRRRLPDTTAAFPPPLQEGRSAWLGGVDGRNHSRTRSVALSAEYLSF